MRVVNDPTCTWCGEEEESSAHILCRCETLGYHRQTMLGSRTLEPIDIKRIGPKDGCSIPPSIHQYADSCFTLISDHQCAIGRLTEVESINFSMFNKHVKDVRADRRNSAGAPSSTRRPTGVLNQVQQLLLCLPSLRQANYVVRRFWSDVHQQDLVPMNKLFLEMLEAYSR
ncbi:unnamed protein product [Callosobruchus maculatus]|uniref:Uncharacterized protein n=1 Tax=Callosobruchus maculatus TaxID=64391 RepID=A0A653CVL4_CALMS|nr:unnamed protein product [Callosobruchus maculatus]